MNRSCLVSAISLLAFTTCLLPAAAIGQDSFGSAPAAPRQEPPATQAPATYPPTAPTTAPPGYGQSPPGYGQPPQSGQPGGGDALGRLSMMERQDMGVAATAQLRSGGLHGPTPASVPGGRLITTQELAPLLQNQQSGALVFDVLGGPQALPQAIPVVPASQGGNFQDQTQQEFGNYLQQVTQGRKDRPMVFYCQSVQCWMSYNASLRAINLGYSQVLWYRGGIEAWQQAGLPLQPTGGGAPPR
ncbi:rhodanese-like domain-containing protein [Arenimonas alkanexedens]